MSVVYSYKHLTIPVVGSGRERLGLAPGMAEAIVLNSDMGYRAQRGEITDGELWEWVAAYLDIESDLPAFRHDFWRGDAVSGDILEFVLSLKPKYQLAILSNATDALTSNLEKYELRELFDLVVGSAYEGVMKPDAMIFHHLLNRLGLNPEETIFIDDSAANVTAARAIGIHAIHYQTGMNLREPLRNLQVDI
jgi:HAD superfamily hydrolase (TIGR01509 family)